VARVLRGDVVRAELSPTRGRGQEGRRPVLVLSQEVFNERSGTVIAVALTTQPRAAGFPLTLELSMPDLPKKSYVKIGQVRTLSTKWLSPRIGKVSPEELRLVIEGLNEIIGE